MTTEEQIAKELYSYVTFEEDVASEDTFRTNEIRLIQRIAFYNGYVEAKKWISIEEKLPELFVPVLVKVEYLSDEFSGEYYYDVDTFIGKDILTGEANFRCNNKVIAWKKIEL